MSYEPDENCRFTAGRPSGKPPVYRRFPADFLLISAGNFTVHARQKIFNSLSVAKIREFGASLLLSLRLSRLNVPYHPNSLRLRVRHLRIDGAN